MIETVSFVCLLVLFFCLALNLVRVVKGPSLADRALAADMIYLNLVAVVVVFSIYKNTALFFDLVLVFSLLGFVGTVCFAKFIGRGRMIK